MAKNNTAGTIVGLLVAVVAGYAFLLFLRTHLSSSSRQGSTGTAKIINSVGQIFSSSTNNDNYRFAPIDSVAVATYDVGDNAMTSWSNPVTVYENVLSGDNYGGDNQA